MWSGRRGQLERWRRRWFDFMLMGVDAAGVWGLECGAYLCAACVLVPVYIGLGSELYSYSLGILYSASPKSRHGTGWQRQKSSINIALKSNLYQYCNTAQHSPVLGYRNWPQPVLRYDPACERRCLNLVYRLAPRERRTVLGMRFSASGFISLDCPCHGRFNHQTTSA